MKLLGTVIVGSMLLISPAYANMFCVQQQLSNLGYEPGPIDGAFGGKTANAAAAFAIDFSATLPVLDKTNSEPWCEALTAAAVSPEGVARRFDVSSRPDGVLSEASAQKLWDLHKNIDECLAFDAIPGAEGYGITLTDMRPDALANAAWTSPFTQAIGAATCQALMPNFGAAPAPVPVVRLDERYGQRQAEVDASMEWFQRASTFVRMTGDPVARAALKTALLDWAKVDSLGEGIRVSWGNRPMDYQMMAAVLGLVAATAEVIPDLTTDDKAILGPWLGDLVEVAAQSHWRDRPDNKQLMRSYITLLWGIVVDDNAAVREGIDAYKLALHDMRPDGSFPVDSQRGAMGIQYNSYNVSYLLQMASAAKHAYGLDLFAYDADGRSIHDAVDFMIRSIKSPGETNAIYALSCPDSGDLFGSISEPSLGFLDDAPTLLIYAEQFPDRENSAWIKSNVTPPQNMILSEHSGGAAACQFAAPTNAVFSGEPIKVEGVYALPQPKFVLRPTEEMTMKTGKDPKVNSLLFSELDGADFEEAGLKKLSFNVIGRYNFAKKNFTELALLFGQNLEERNVDAIKSCGPYFGAEQWDDGSQHLVVKFAIRENVFTAPDLSCVASLAPDEVTKTASFMSANFRDFAIGMVQNNALPTIQHDGLREWMEAVAIGDIEVRGPSAN